MSFTREGGKQFLTIKVIPEIEKLFKTRETETSERYKTKDGSGLSYYKLSTHLDEYTNTFVQNYGRGAVLSRYGTDLYIDGGAVNVSILRTVGLSKGISVAVDGLIVDTDVQRWMQSFAHYIKFLHQTFIQKTEIKAVINLEL